MPHDDEFVSQFASQVEALRGVNLDNRVVSLSGGAGLDVSRLRDYFVQLYDHTVVLDDSIKRINAALELGGGNGPAEVAEAVEAFVEFAEGEEDDEDSVFCLADDDCCGGGSCMEPAQFAGRLDAAGGLANIIDALPSGSRITTTIEVG